MTKTPSTTAVPNATADPRRRRRAMYWVVSVVALGGLAAAATWLAADERVPTALLEDAEQAPAPAPLPSTPAETTAPTPPAATGSALRFDGHTFAIATISGEAFRVPAGRPTVLFFMNTEGCGECAEEAGALDSIAEQRPGEVAILAVEMVPGTPRESLEGFSESLGGLDYALAVDDGQLVRRFGARALSTTVVLDGAGREVFRDAVSSDETTLTRALARASQGGA